MINFRVLWQILTIEMVFLGLVVLLVTNVVRGGTLYWVVMGGIAASAWGGVALSRRLFAKPRGANDPDASS